MSLLFTLRSNSVSLRALELHFVYSCVFKFPRDVTNIPRTGIPCRQPMLFVGGSQVVRYLSSNSLVCMALVEFVISTGRYVYFAISMNMRVFLCTLDVSIYLCILSIPIRCQMGNCMMFGNLELHCLIHAMKPKNIVLYNWKYNFQLF